MIRTNYIQFQYLLGRILSILLLVYLFLFPTPLGAQESENSYVDSLKKVISETTDFKEKVDCYWLWDNEIYWQDEELDFELNHKMLAICESRVEMSDTSSNYFFYKKIAAICNNLGILFNSRGDYENGLAYFHKSKRISEKSGNNYLVASAQINIGSIYIREKKFETALNYLNEAIPYATLLSKEDTLHFNSGKKLLNSINSNVAFIYVRKYYNAEGAEKAQYLDTAISKSKFAINQSLELLEGLSSESELFQLSSTLIMSYNDLALIYLDIKEYDLAFDYFTKILKRSRELNYSSGISSSLDGLAKYYFAKGNLKKAISTGVESKNKAEEFGDLGTIINSSELLWGFYKANNEYKLALEQYEQFVTFSDSLNNLSNEKVLIENDYRLEYEKKALTDSLNFINQKRIKDEVIEKQEIKLGKERNQKIGLSVFTILLAIVAMLIYRGFRQKKHANEIISVQKKNVERHRKKMVDSITYAEKIQTSLLPSINEIRKIFPGLVNLNLPKDIVSGDFFWYHNEEDISYFALSDCTGHGVPGAFMSIIGTNLLKEIIINKNCSELNDILFNLDEGLINLLNQHDETATADGMDIGIIKFDKKAQKIEFAGANQNLYVVSENSTALIKGELRSVGGWVRKRSRLPNFTTKNITLKGVKAIYLATDGLEDQLGGPNYRKFGRDTFVSMIDKMGDSPNMESINLAFSKWKGKNDQLDDISVIGIKL